MVEVVGESLQTGRGAAVRPDGSDANCKGQGWASDSPCAAHLINGHQRLSTCLLNCFEKNNVDI